MDTTRHNNDNITTPRQEKGMEGTSPTPSGLEMTCKPGMRIPKLLTDAWSVRTPTDDLMIVDQLNSEEKCFLVMMSYFIDISAFKLDKMLAYTEPQEVLSEILSTARHHLHCLTKQTKLSPHFVVTVALLHMLMSLFTSDRMKYISLKQFLEAYPTFHDRSPQEQERLFHTANCMHILFQVINPKMKKGMVMEIVPKFVEGNHANYVTGGGQTQATKDRVRLYEMEGNVHVIKRRPKRKLGEEKTNEKETKNVKGEAAKDNHCSNNAELIKSMSSDNGCDNENGQNLSKKPSEACKNIPLEEALKRIEMKCGKQRKLARSLPNQITGASTPKTTANSSLPTGPSCSTIKDGIVNKMQSTVPPNQFVAKPPSATAPKPNGDKGGLPSSERTGSSVVPSTRHAASTTAPKSNGDKGGLPSSERTGSSVVPSTRHAASTTAPKPNGDEGGLPSSERTGSSVVPSTRHAASTTAPKPNGDKGGLPSSERTGSSVVPSTRHAASTTAPKSNGDKGGLPSSETIGSSAVPSTRHAASTTAPKPNGDKGGLSSSVKKSSAVPPSQLVTKPPSATSPKPKSDKSEAHSTETVESSAVPRSQLVTKPPSATAPKLNGDKGGLPSSETIGSSAVPSTRHAASTTAPKSIGDKGGLPSSVKKSSAVPPSQLVTKPPSATAPKPNGDKSEAHSSETMGSSAVPPSQLVTKSPSATAPKLNGDKGGLPSSETMGSSAVPPSQLVTKPRAPKPNGDKGLLHSSVKKSSAVPPSQLVTKPPSATEPKPNGDKSGLPIENHIVTSSSHKKRSAPTEMVESSYNGSDAVSSPSFNSKEKQQKHVTNPSASRSSSSLIPEPQSATDKNILRNKVMSLTEDKTVSVTEIDKHRNETEAGTSCEPIVGLSKQSPDMKQAILVSDNACDSKLVSVGLLNEGIHCDCGESFHAESNCISSHANPSVGEQDFDFRGESDGIGSAQQGKAKESECKISALPLKPNQRSRKHCGEGCLQQESEVLKDRNNGKGALERENYLSTRLPLKKRRLSVEATSVVENVRKKPMGLIEAAIRQNHRTPGKSIYQ